MLQTMEHRGPDGAGYVIGKSCERAAKLESLNFRGKKGYIALGHVRLAITGERAGLQPFQSDDSKLSLLHNGEIYNYYDLLKELNGKTSLSTGSDSEVLFRLIETEYKGDLTKAVEEVFPKLDGVYALAITDQEKTIIARDKIGVRQLYYYRTSDFVAFASEKKALLALGGDGADIRRLPPGHIMMLRPDSFRLQPFWTPDQLRAKEHIADPQEAMEAYDLVIREAVRKRVDGKDHVGIIFSGGVDSCMIAYLVKHLGVPFTCYTAGREEGATDVEWAHRSADKFGFPLQVKTLSIDEIKHLIPEVIRTIEDYSLNQVEVAIPIYASARMAHEAGERVILTGQGADELFGGYPWYATIVDREGYDIFDRRSWEDTFLLYKECLEREDKIAMAHSMELRVPFLDSEVIRVAFQIAPELKIQRGGDSLGKRIHRAYCSFGMTDEIAFRPKEAAQHGANVHDAFEEIAESHGLTASLLEDVGYDPEKTVQEKLGSSSRYGYQYGAEHLWKPLPHVQYYLDSHAVRLGLLPRLPHYYWDKTRRKLADRGIQLLQGGVQ
ncbi:MAG: asparagine synthetase B family protein [bacterium]